MIKVGIIGAETPDAGELLRILHHHPEVEIKTLYSPSWAGRLVSARHHGFIGEEIGNFTEKIDLNKIDILFISDDSEKGVLVLRHSEELPELRIVDMSPGRFSRWEGFGLEYGLSEVNRKPLVRGARLAVLPTPIASLALIALYPLALNILLTSDIEITVEAPKEFLDSVNKREVTDEITGFLARTQKSFSSKVELNLVARHSGRSMRVTCTLKCPLAIAEVDKVYESVYDDHNFTYISHSGVNRNEVEGTHKCVLTFEKPAAGLLEVSALGDYHMRGGAGDATHVLNLLFALDEKVGLYLKPSLFGDEDAHSNNPGSWFA